MQEKASSGLSASVRKVTSDPDSSQLLSFRQPNTKWLIFPSYVPVSPLAVWPVTGPKDGALQVAPSGCDVQGGVFAAHTH